MQRNRGILLPLLNTASYDFSFIIIRKDRKARLITASLQKNGTVRFLNDFSQKWAKEKDETFTLASWKILVAKNEKDSQLKETKFQRV